MDKLSKITDVLLAYAKGTDVHSIPRVLLNFEHAPTDIPGETSWTLEVRLTTTSNKNGNGSVEKQEASPLEKRFAFSALNREECQEGILKGLNDFLTEEIAERMSQMEALETAMNLLNADSTLEEVLQADPKAMELAEQEQEERQQDSPLIIIAGR